MIRIDVKTCTPKSESQETVLSIQSAHIQVKLREAIEAHRVRTGVRLTYAALAKATGLSEATLQSLAARPNYNPRLSTIACLCEALGCAPGDLLELSGGQG
jgi:DNA-binding Xre family transcriptional regulator